MKDEIRPTTAESSLPIPPSSVPRWTGPEIIGAMLLALACQSLVYLALDGFGWFRWYYGEGLTEVLKQGDEVARLAALRLGLWTGTVAGIFQVVLTLGWFRATSGTRPAELGLTTERLGRGVVAGLLFAVIFAPGAYGIQALTVLVMKRLGVEDQPHPFTMMGQGSLFPAEWALLIVSAVVVAPVWEELMYRGVIQPWVMSRQPLGGPVALAAALAMALSVRADPFRTAVETGGAAVLIELIPFACLLSTLPVYALVNARSPQAAGLFASAVLFAWIHARVWPSPVPLLWLALGLGWLRWKTGSLAGSIVLHAVFNAIACALLVGSLWWKTN